MREIQLEEMYIPSRRPKHCGAVLDPSPGDGIWECVKCDKWVHFPSGIPEKAEGRDLESFEVIYNQLMN